MEPILAIISIGAAIVSPIMAVAVGYYFGSAPADGKPEAKRAEAPPLGKDPLIESWLLYVKRLQVEDVGWGGLQPFDDPIRRNVDRPILELLNTTEGQSLVNNLRALAGRSSPFHDHQF